MNKREIDSIVSLIYELKNKHNLKIIDSHVHPHDVMGVVHHNDYTNNDRYDDNLLKYNHSLSEKLKFNYFVNLLSKIVYKIYPKMVFDEINKMYDNVHEERFLSEMNESHIDEVVFLPVEPWAMTSKLKEYYKNKRFHILGSIDIHKDTLLEVHENLKKILELGIVGIKLHPNLQNFKPQPSDNSNDVTKKLETIYKFAENNNLYILFHGGKSLYTKNHNNKYKNFSRSSNNALLSNFCDYKGESEILGKYSIPIVIAHLGHFGQNRINKKLVRTIIDNHENVYFDTAAMSPKMIKDFIKISGSDRIILGSDAIYNRMVCSIYIVFEAIKKANLREDINDSLIKIISKNYYNKILKNNS